MHVHVLLDPAWRDDVLKYCDG